MIMCCACCIVCVCVFVCVFVLVYVCMLRVYVVQQTKEKARIWRRSYSDVTHNLSPSRARKFARFAEHPNKIEVDRADPYDFEGATRRLEILRNSCPVNRTLNLARSTSWSAANLF